MKMIVGLGNIGPQYQGTRHNTGFMVVERFAAKAGLNFSTRKMEAKLASGIVNGEKILLVEPETFMNESGRAVGALAHFYKIETSDIIIVQDDMDMTIGRIRLRAKGSAGGHNGIKSIIASLGTSEFDRIKVGIAHPSKANVVNYVLGKFTPDQQIDFDNAADHAVAALFDWIDNVSMTDLMNRYN
ncbi:aminoacyl-tRNA hydrolase [Secundilactobacillus collinoides]|uniref:Peptidyl-tRNA hydrolase n=2 Tax=Secundilactobacillus collinoides TaxID=33960 RepID=A0A0R2B361_SECCO|nr:aminoacyl-tRNA hydrolase [Secundilactobacillus collinoides]KRM73921.1 peptidyl-tRNA hydrolase [Secundilactobacillus collinoides DSM 20515 = JCM 1123]KZL41680.1 peptidyl-tRNA hydrolase [Secundilactobacillus collinoides]